MSRGWAESKQRLVQMSTHRTPGRAETRCQGDSEAKPGFEARNRAEGKGGQPETDRDPGSQAQRGDLVSPHLKQESPSRALALQNFQHNEMLLWEAAEGARSAGMDVRAHGEEGTYGEEEEGKWTRQGGRALKST